MYHVRWGVHDSYYDNPRAETDENPTSLLPQWYSLKSADVGLPSSAAPSNPAGAARVVRALAV